MAARCRTRGRAEVIFLLLCGVLACVAIALMVRHADDFEPMLEIVRSEWRALNEEFDRTVEALEALFGAPRVDEEEGPALLVAARDGDGARLLRLLAAGADVNVTDDAGRTPLMHAAEQGRMVVARVLLEAGADRGLRDDAGHTAADYAQRGGHAALAELLSPPDREPPAAEQDPNQGVGSLP